MSFAVGTILLVGNILFAGYNFHNYLQTESIINMLLGCFSVSAAILVAITLVKM